MTWRAIRGILAGRRRGSVLTLVAVVMPATLGAMALAIDLGMMFQSRLQAQSAADVAALAGASAFQNPVLDVAATEAEAESRAREWAATNRIRGEAVDPVTEVHVEVRSDRKEVYVRVERRNIPTWFARFLGIASGNVAAGATAQASPAGGVECLRPLAIPDYWLDGDDDTNGNMIWDPDEQWTFTPGTDIYNPFDSGSTPETGFGSDLRNPSQGNVNDFGTQLTLQLPLDTDPVARPGWFYPLALPGQSFGDALRECPPGQFYIGETLPTSGPVDASDAEAAFYELIQGDADSYWDPVLNGITNTSYPDFRDNPRVMMIAVFDPRQLDSVGAGVEPTNFGYYYVEGWRRQDGSICDTGPGCGDTATYTAPLIGRFLYYAEGVGSQGPTGPLILQLRLVD